jgi:DNA-binding NarL/FixJ family response regulator
MGMGAIVRRGGRPVHTGAQDIAFRPSRPWARGHRRGFRVFPKALYGERVPAEVRVVVGEDDVLMREGIVRLLVEAGFEVAGQAGDAEEFLRKVLAHRPDVAVVDVRMPPGHVDDGLKAAIELRRRRPETGVLVLSQYYEEAYALDLIGDSAEGVGYLLKERVGDVEAFTDAVARVAAGGSALDPEVVGRMLGRRRPEGALDRLSPRDRDVLAHLAEGKSNRGIAEALVISNAAVEKRITSIFTALDLEPEPTEHRRVLAALTYINHSRR